MIWNHSDTSELKMKNLSDSDLQRYLEKIDTKTFLLMVFIKLKLMDSSFSNMLKETETQLWVYQLRKLLIILINLKNEKIFWNNWKPY